MFETRRRATSAEIARLIASFDAIAPPGLEDADVSEVASLSELGAMHTVLAISDPRPSTDSFYTIAELAPGWNRGGGSAHDQDSYRRALARVADPTYAPELLFEPTRLTSSGWWMIDAIHRAVAFYNTRAAAGVTTLRLPVFVLSRQLR